MTNNQLKVERTVKTLAEQSAELAMKEQALLADIKAKQALLEEVVLQRCAIAEEERKGFGPTKKKKIQPDWQNLLSLKKKARKSTRLVRDKALRDLHLMRGWVSWSNLSQIMVAFELQKDNPAELFWVNEGILEILPHIKPAQSGYKVLAISHTGAFSLRYFLMCGEVDKSYRIVDSEAYGPGHILFESSTLRDALEFIQKNFAR